MTTDLVTPTTAVAEAPQFAKSEQHSKLLERVAFLESALLSQDPQMPKHLAEIHKLLIQHEELAHLLSEDEIAKIMQAQQLQTNTTLFAVTEAKAKKEAKAKVAKLTMADI